MVIIQKIIQFQIVVCERKFTFTDSPTPTLKFLPPVADWLRPSSVCTCQSFPASFRYKPNPGPRSSSLFSEKPPVFSCLIPPLLLSCHLHTHDGTSVPSFSFPLAVTDLEIQVPLFALISS